jgi:hypothetical protein
MVTPARHAQRLIGVLLAVLLLVGGFAVIDSDPRGAFLLMICGALLFALSMG